MNGQTSGLQRNQVVSPAIISIARSARHPEISRAGNPLPPSRCNRAKGVVAVGAGLHFDKGNDPAF
jgi:hypothetical protein